MTPVMRQAWPDQESRGGDSTSIFLSPSHHLCGVGLIGDSIVLVIHQELALGKKISHTHCIFEVTDFAIPSMGFPL